MNPSEREALKTAVEKQRNKEPFEKSLGRTFRNVGLDFDAYILVISEVREVAKREKVSLEEAALRLATGVEQR
jgi:hypothetical protein